MSVHAGIYADKTYSGWRNYETWNCALWINNDYKLYISACAFMQGYKGKTPYKTWIKIADLEGKQTIDGARWSGKKLSYTQLNNMMKELVE